MQVEMDQGIGGMTSVMRGGNHSVSFCVERAAEACPGREGDAGSNRGWEELINKPGWKGLSALDGITITCEWQAGRTPVHSRLADR